MDGLTISKLPEKVNEPLKAPAVFDRIGKMDCGIKDPVQTAIHRTDRLGDTMHTKKEYIAVFDSGVGGISVLRQLRKRMPNEKFVYYGDSANAPYGSRSTKEVRRLSLAAAEKLMEEYPVKALVVACNTATAAAIDTLREKYPDEIIVGIEPAVKLAADRHTGGNIGVMATEVTLREEKFDLLMQRFHGGCTIHKIPAPGLVRLIEAGQGDSDVCLTYLRELLQPYIGKLDALVLGCTHYPFVKHNIQGILGPGTEVLHGGEGTARETKRRLAEKDLLWDGPGETVILTSGGESMIALSRRLLGEA